MEEVRIKVTRRSVIGKSVKYLRQEGQLPAVVYGSDLGSIPISVDLKEMTQKITGMVESSIITLDLEGDNHSVLLREIQRHVISGVLSHLDFQVVSLDEARQANVRFVLEGVAPVVQNTNAVLVMGLDRLKVESLPQLTPKQIIIDVSVLKELGDKIEVRHLSLPEGVKILNNPEEMIVTAKAGLQIVEEEEEVEEVEELLI